MNIHTHINTKGYRENAHEHCPETPCVGPRCRAKTGKTQTKRENKGKRHE